MSSETYSELFPVAFKTNPRLLCGSLCLLLAGYSIANLNVEVSAPQAGAESVESYRLYLPLCFLEDVWGA